MPNYTPNINLVKPLGSENYDISKVTNDNADILDTQVASKAPINNPTFTGTVSGISKSMVGLGNVDNTSDANKPVSTAQQTQINTRQLKNWIINGGFDVWQRGTSQTTSGYGSDDRWNNSQITSTKTHSRQLFTVGQTDVPNNPAYFSRTIVTSVAGAGSLVKKEQSIEDVTKLAGKTVSISFWAKADASKNISIEFVQVFGTGGSTAIVAIGVQKFALTTTWKRFTKTVTLPSVSGKTIVTDNFTRFSFYFDAGSDYNTRTDSLGNQSGTFDIANVSLVEGSVPVEWQTEAYADVLRKCQNYCFEDYITCSGTLGGSGGVVILSFQFPQKMRKIPTYLYISGGKWDNGFGEKSITSVYPVQTAYLSDVGIVALYNSSGSGSPGQGIIVYGLRIRLDAEL